MPEHRHVAEVFIGEKVTLDDGCFIKCAFEDCELIFAGTAGVVMHSNYFERCRWTFKDAAGTTLHFLRAMGVASPALLEAFLDEQPET